METELCGTSRREVMSVSILLSYRMTINSGGASRDNKLESSSNSYTFRARQIETSKTRIEERFRSAAPGKYEIYVFLFASALDFSRFIIFRPLRMRVYIVGYHWRP